MEVIKNCCHVYDLQYYQDEGLHTLEAFAEGTFTIAGKLKVERKYIPSGASAEEEAKYGSKGNYTYHTKVTNIVDDAGPVRG